MNYVVEEMKAIIEGDENTLEHYGMPRRSGRYPYGSGEDPYQHGRDFLGRVEEMRKSGFTYIDKDGKKYTGDTAIVKREITTGKNSYTAYVYDGEWKAMDGNYRADNVYFDDDITYTVAIGTLSKPSGSAKFNTKGKNVEQVVGVEKWSLVV